MLPIIYKRRPPVHVLFEANKVTLTDLHRDTSFEELADEPFSAPHIILAEFELAAETLKKAVEKAEIGKREFKHRTVIVQQIIEPGDELTQIEWNMLSDIPAYYLGCRNSIALQHGRPLSTEEIISETGKKHAGTWNGRFGK